MVKSTVVRLMLVSAIVLGTSGTTIQLFPDGQVPSERAGYVGEESCVGGTMGIDYGGGNDTTCSNVSVPTLTPFMVLGSDTAVVVAPGGGYASLTWDREGTDAARWLNSIGVSAFVLKYRVPARPWLGWGEAPFMDGQRAISLLRSNASQFQLNSSKIGFMGFSAGGHLASHLSVGFNRSYDRIDAIDDVSSRPDFTLLIYPGLSHQTFADNVTKTHPPTFIMQAENDPFDAANGLEYYLQLKKQSAPPSEIHVYRTGGHAYGLCSVRDTDGKVAALVTSTEPGPPVTPAFVPWSDVCTWNERAEGFLKSIWAPTAASTASKLKVTHSSIALPIV